MIAREKFIEWQSRSRKIAQTGSEATSREDEGERSEATTSTMSLMKPEGIHQMWGVK